MEEKEEEKHKTITLAEKLLMEIKGISKVFPGVIALNKINLSIKEGELHAIVGENGAGKSTLCKIIMGIYQPDEGELFWNGEQVKIDSPRQAFSLGIRIVYQERNLVPFLTGAQNIFLGEEILKNGLVDEQEILKNVEKMINNFHTIVPINVPVSNLKQSQRQLIEIMRALRGEPKLLILDEPTSSLSEKDRDAFFEVLDNIKKKGVTIIFISHKLDEVFAISNRISIFRNGEKVFTGKTKELTQKECIEYMVNRSIDRLYPEVVNHSKEDIILKVENLKDKHVHHVVKDVSFHVKKGEVVGLYGLIGSGRTEAMEIIYGISQKENGEIYFDRDLVPDKELSPTRMIKKGLYLIPEDRKENGLFYGLTLRENVSVSFLKDLLTPFLPGRINKKKEKELTLKLLESEHLKVVYSDIESLIDNLSGGNQQKVIISRWIHQTQAKLLIADDPTVGIDVGTKYEIYVLLRNLAKKGLSVVFISSEMPELLGVSDRIYVFKEGVITKEVLRKDFDPDKILSYAL